MMIAVGKHYRELGDVLFMGNPGSTLTGIIPHTVVVDDPHDYVAQSAGVLVLKAPSMGKTRVMDTVFDHVGPQRSQMGKTKAVDAVMKKHPGPTISAKRAKMSGVKGLR